MNQTSVGELSPAMEMTTAELVDIIGGRKELFNQFYDRVVTAMRSRGSQLMRAISRYRDKNVETLSSPYLLNYTIFGVEDQQVVWKVTGIDEDEVSKAIKTMKKFIRDNCKIKGYQAPASLFVNVTPFRVILLLIMRYYLERGQREELDEVCAYMGYSMFYTIFINSFRHGIRKETMIYTMTTMSNKHKLKHQKDVDGLLTYGISLCVQTYKQRIMDCTDHDIIYVIGQFKSREHGYIVSIAQKYYENDKKKEAVFTSNDMLSNEEGTAEFVERNSTTGLIDSLAQEYASKFFQKPVDDQIVNICAKMNDISRTEFKNALVQMKADKGRIPEMRAFYEGIFYLYTDAERGKELDVHSKRFLSVMNDIYKKGNSKEKNITAVKGYLDKWLSAASAFYRENNRSATLNNYRRATFQYLIFAVTLRR